MESIKAKARIAGLLYLLSAPFAFFSVIYLPSLIIAPLDAARTLQNLQAHLFLFRLGIVSLFVSQLFYLIMPLLLYRLLSPVNRGMAAVMVALIVVSVPITFVNELNNLAAIRLATAGGLDANSVKDQVMHLLLLRQDGILISGIFWGLWLLPMGLLVYRSGFLPRVLGVFLVIGCAGYVFDTVAGFLSPGTTFKLGAFTFLGEIAFPLWLLIRGVNTRRMGVDAKASM